ncbi:MAG: hypothetical protein WAW42_19345 [Candidatus Competibacteraceae bacterium]
MHAQVEEEIFYPAVQVALKDKGQVPEATMEHTTLKALIAQVEGVEHHVKEEENEMFPQAKSSSLDMRELGARVSERTAELAPSEPSPAST